MKITVCSWEKRNIGDSTLEIQVEAGDTFSEQIIIEAEKDYEYSVIKVPVNNFDFNLGLTKLGYSIAEMQMSMIVRIKDFPYNHKLIKWVYPHVSFKEAESSSDIEETLSKIQPGMFSTDRISLDPHYGEKIGCKRYLYWIQDELIGERSKLLNIYYKDNNVGFILYRGIGTVRGLLGGIYPKYQNLGLGLLTPSALPLYLKDSVTTKVLGDISSNNKPVWELYETFNYKVSNPQYVFIKHIK